METLRHRKLIVGAAVALGIGLLTSAGTASAHVSIAEGEAVAGESTVLTFGFSHGCDGSPTTEIRIQMPESIPTISPTINANWTAEKVMEELDEPVEGGHGTTLTERVSEVVYTAVNPVADGYRDTFELSMAMPADAAGQTISFPTIQTCEEGETAWIEIPAEGQDPHDLDAPAPGIAVIAATDDGGEHSGDDGDDANAADDAIVEEASVELPAESEDSSDNSGSDGLAIGALVVGLLALVIGGTAIWRTRSA
ncbi:YcnI family protein [Ilumatobacter sp.]|uniref:YcnI family copper-binding membrane protein n=1 Tax=Ilumatobacter sp. TaxID=1967498 RepID=UPI003C5C9ADD